MYGRTLAVSLLLLGNGAWAQADEAAPTAMPDGVVVVGAAAPFVDSNLVARNIIDECDLPHKQIADLKGAVPDLVVDDAVASGGQGRVLRVEIVNALSSGNAFIGHHKQVQIRGRLLENGNEIGSFSGTRGSMGGAFAGFKGSCSVLHRCTEALAGDVAKWLKQPSMNARIGE